MTFTVAKAILFALSVLNLLLISIFISLGKNKAAVALAVLEAILVTSTVYVE